MMSEILPKRRCIYCFREKPIEEFSLEHIWPDALGGALCGDFFKTREVCEKCNNLCGLFVDGAFIKSWFVQMEIANQGYRFLDPSKPTAVPLHYLGVEPGLPTEEGEICERWQGPAGERIYHIHLADEERWDTLAGGDTIRRKKKDPGRAYLTLSSSNEFWSLTAALSFKQQFAMAKRCVLTEVAIDDPKFAPILPVLFPQGDPADPQQARDRRVLAHALSNNSVHARIPVQADFDGRFLCKLALGIGHKIFGKRHGESGYGAELRKGLWAKHGRERRELRIHGTGMLGKGQDTVAQQLREFLTWPGAWTICIWNHGDRLAAHVHSPGGIKLSIVIAEELSSYPEIDPEIYRDGQMYIISLPGESFVGPLALPEVLAHKLGNRVVRALSEIEMFGDSMSMLPPKNLSPRAD
ncbi:HNH endonuclease (plasmid) [Rhizobium leguminosarum]|uniref:HNH endonuclease n=2 Tax=Rhizobium leguminosarum TaxID=384 RepID=UPI00102F3986|nr:HNH endonuclease [Rhizobium leguminosarum]TBF43443.1 HNH endonuclease [Rhizobium leguminosarum]TBF46261.1 HNH endonuclease [Rhizobium leguminosarum]TBF47678.1 HNH endonuclease [Rhizobium leguminosarum]TBF65153.1 HNH endonuclease [Rhizobium leguminosarum]TBF67314.1 HNH endonuclease [Rhizobium leguminosarum]